jgi:hypothetical protein
MDAATTNDGRMNDELLNLFSYYHLTVLRAANYKEVGALQCAPKNVRARLVSPEDLDCCPSFSLQVETGGCVQPFDLCFKLSRVFRREHHFLPHAALHASATLPPLLYSIFCFFLGCAVQSIDRILPTDCLRLNPLEFMWIRVLCGLDQSGFYLVHPMVGSQLYQPAAAPLLCSAQKPSLAKCKCGV